MTARRATPGECPFRCIPPCQPHEPCWLRGEDDIEFLLDRTQARHRERVMEVLREEGRADLAAEYAAKMRELDTGVLRARNVWQALSPAQRRVMEIMEPGRTLRRRDRLSSRYDAYGNPHAESNVCGVRTVRNLAARELVAWEGGAFAPEARAVLTEHGRFVLRHGREGA